MFMFRSVIGYAIFNSTAITGDRLLNMPYCVRYSRVAYVLNRSTWIMATIQQWQVILLVLVIVQDSILPPWLPSSKGYGVVLPEICCWNYTLSQMLILIRLRSLPSPSLQAMSYVQTTCIYNISLTTRWMSMHCVHCVTPYAREYDVILA